MKKKRSEEIKMFSDSGSILESAASRDFSLLDELIKASLQMSDFDNIDKLITFFVNTIAQLFKAARVSFMFLDGNSKELSVKASYGLGVSANKAKIKLGEMFVGWVAQEREPLLVKDIEAEYPDLFKDRVSRYKTRSFIIVPITAKEGIIGIVNLTDKKDSSVFTEDDLRLARLICHYFALNVENIRLSQKNTELAIIDRLTGLFNHRYFQEHLLEEIYHAERYRQHLSLMMLDIDDFRLYNKNFGYSAGDAALKKIAAIIKENIRRVDAAVRYGPEEFMLILPKTRLKQAILVGDRIRDAIDYSVFTEDRSSSFGMAKLTASIGVTEYKIGLAKEEFTRNVISALLEAKDKGKNRICSFK